jgi:hypothetical protein
MKKNIHFFYCTFNVTLKYGEVGERATATKDPIHHYTELVEVGKDETAPEAFNKWIEDKRESLKGKWSPAWNPEPILTYAFVLAP